MAITGRTFSKKSEEHENNETCAYRASRRLLGQQYCGHRPAYYLDHLGDRAGAAGAEEHSAAERDLAACNPDDFADRAEH